MPSFQHERFCFQSQNVRIPLIMFPIVLSSLADAIVSLGRISKFLLAEELEHMPTVDPSQNMAVSVDGDFEWEVVDGAQAAEQKGDDKDKELKLLTEEKKKKKEEEKRRKKEKETSSDNARWKFWKSKKEQKDALPVTSDETRCEDGASSAVEEEKPFDLKDLRLEIQKGAFVAIVGRVGSGKVCIMFLNSLLWIIVFHLNRALSFKL
jgi:ATP-binding cassette subfamily C (CFTR/MRP) protein 1